MRRKGKTGGTEAGHVTFEASRAVRAGVMHISSLTGLTIWQRFVVAMLKVIRRVHRVSLERPLFVACPSYLCWSSKCCHRILKHSPTTILLRLAAHRDSGLPLRQVASECEPTRVTALLPGVPDL